MLSLSMVRKIQGIEGKERREFFRHVTIDFPTRRATNRISALIPLPTTRRPSPGQGIGFHWNDGMGCQARDGQWMGQEGGVRVPLDAVVHLLN